MESKVEIAKERIRYAARESMHRFGEPLAIMYSGGKDSATIAQLAQEALKPCEWRCVYKVTTADAPDNVWHIRREFERMRAEGVECIESRPPKSMWQIIRDNNRIPTRFCRTCCRLLKERNVDGQPYICTGVRWDESPARRARAGVHEVKGQSTKNALILANDNDDARREFETCALKGVRTVNPIIDWTTNEVLAYLHDRRVTMNPLYLWMNRVGCVGCPMAGWKERELAFALFPKIKKAWDDAFQCVIDSEKSKESLEMVKRGFWKTPDDIWQWMGRPDEFWRERGGRPRGFRKIEEATDDEKTD